MSVWAFILTAIIMPMLVTEFTAWLPWLADRMVRAAARTLPPAARERYADEWLAELDAEPGGNLSRLIFAVRVCLRAHATRRAIKGTGSHIRSAVKQVFDRVSAASALLLLAPLFGAIALAIRLEDGGPVFSKQTRVGQDGDTFGVYKFRTMFAGPERRNPELEALNARPGVLLKILFDTRVTKVGGRLRRWSLDELPQLINVLVGDMSLVGPRPALPQEAPSDGEHVRRRFVGKPGITGLWQVSGPRDLSWDEAVRLDLRYVENWSLALDILILWRTWSALSRRRDYL